MSENNPVKTIAFIGAGHIGGTLATLWSRAGYRVFLSSRHPEELTEQARKIGARAGAVEEAARIGDVVVITVPLKNVPDVARAVGPLLKGKLLIDTNNPYPNRDGALAADAKAGGQGSAEWFAKLFPESRVVKAFNSVYYETLLQRSDRENPSLGIPLASDDPQAMHIVAGLTRDAGHEPVEVGGLERSKEFDVGTPAYNSGASADELRALFDM